MTLHNSTLFKLIQKFPWISKFITVTDGYIEEEIPEEHYRFGANKLKGKEILVEDGNWLPFIPENEEQRGNRVETMGCTGYSLLNILEMIAKRKWGEDWNKSDRFTNKMSGTGYNGNSMTTVLDSVRKYHGVVNETSWPWDRSTFTWSNYYALIDQEIQNLGKEFLKVYEVGYEIVSQNKQLMAEALKYSPLYVAGYAWYLYNGLYRSYARANHAFTLIRQLDTKKIAYDSYNPFIKNLDPDFQFGVVFLITLNKKSLEYSQADIDRLRQRGFKFIMRTDKINGGLGQIYELTDNGLKELTEQEKKDWAVRALADRNDLTGISEADYFKLIK